MRKKNLTGLNLHHNVHCNGQGFQRDRNEEVLKPSKNVISGDNAYYEFSSMNFSLFPLE